MWSVSPKKYRNKDKKQAAIERISVTADRPEIAPMCLDLVFSFVTTFQVGSFQHSIKKKCLKAVDILCVVTHLDWGADRAVLFSSTKL